MFKKILIAAPTSKEKNYCAEEWINNVFSFTYPNFDVVLFDNTPDNGENAIYLSELHKKNLGLGCKDRGFAVLNSMQFNNVNPIPENVIERMCYSHNDCRFFALKGDYDYMFSLETDVFPSKDVIENLLYHSKDVVGALYHIGEGRHRSLMVQKHINRAPRDLMTLNAFPNEDVFFVDGELKEVAHVGLGAVMISKKVLQKINFRFNHNEFVHPDTFFAEDCFRNKIKIYADTSICCRHDNKNWNDEEIKHRVIV